VIHTGSILKSGGLDTGAGSCDGDGVRAISVAPSDAGGRSGDAERGHRSDDQYYGHKATDGLKHNYLPPIGTL